MNRMIAAVVLVVLLAAAAAADVVVLKSGERRTGRIVEESTHSVVLETVVANIPTRLTIERHRIDSIERDAAPADERAPGEGLPSTETRLEAGGDAVVISGPAPDGTGETRYLVVPIRGVIGVEALAAGVEASVEAAAKHGAPWVVVEVDSPGGSDAEARAIGAAMHSHGGRVRFAAVVRRAERAAMWPVLASEAVFVVEGASLGGAIGPISAGASGDEGNGDAVEMFAAAMASLAESRGHSVALCRGMAVAEAEVYRHRDMAGRIVLSGEPPEESSDGLVIRLDGAESVMVLTAEEAVSLGLARGRVAGVEDVGAALGLAGWRQASDFGERAMGKARAMRAKAERDAAMEALRAERRRGELEERIPALQRYLAANEREALMLDPSRRTSTYTTAAGVMTPESQKRWREATDDAIAAWERVLAGVEELARCEEEAEALGLARATHEIDLADLRGRAEREMERLGRNRLRTRL